MSRRTLLLLRWGVFLLACAFLFARFNRPGAEFSVIELGRSLSRLGIPVISGLLMLMVANWVIEALKWRALIKAIEPVSRRRAFIATLAGTSIGLITPNRVGEFVGRVLFLKPENRVAGSFASAVGSIAQFSVTVVLGMVGAAAMLAKGEWSGELNLLAAWLGGCALVATATLILFYNPALLRAVIARLPLIKRWERHAAVLDRYSPMELSRVLVLSALRYAVFTLQFAWLVQEMAGIPWCNSLATVSAAFLVGSLIPTVMVTELGVRASVAVSLISTSAVTDQGVLAASGLLWALNLALPALVGVFIILTARIRSARA